MAGVESKGSIDRGLEAWQKFNEVTLSLGVGAWVLGSTLGPVWLATLGKASIALDAAQIIGVKIIQEVKKNFGKKSPAMA